MLPPPPPLKKNQIVLKEKQGPVVSRVEDDDIFVGDGVDYTVPGKDLSQSPLSEDMEESPRNKEKPSYFSEPAYGPVPPSGPPQEWQEAVCQHFYLLHVKFHNSLSNCIRYRVINMLAITSF